MKILFVFIWYFFFLGSKRTVPLRNPDTIRKQLLEPWASWRIDRLTSYLTDLVKIKSILNENILNWFHIDLDTRWTTNSNEFIGYWSIVWSIKPRWSIISAHCQRIDRSKLLNIEKENRMKTKNEIFYWFFFLQGQSSTASKFFWTIDTNINFINTFTESRSYIKRNSFNVKINKFNFDLEFIINNKKN